MDRKTTNKIMILKITIRPKKASLRCFLAVVSDNFSLVCAMQLKDRKRIDHFSCSNVMRVKGGVGYKPTTAAQAVKEGRKRPKRPTFICWARFLVSLSHASFLVALETHLTFPSLPSPSPVPCHSVKLVHLSVRRFNLLQFFLLPQRSRTEICSSSCRQAWFLVAFRSGCLDLLPRQIRLMWCALGARGSNPAAAPRALIPDFDEALAL